MAGDTPTEKRRVLKYKPDIEFRRRPISGDGGIRAEDDIEARRESRVDGVKQRRRRRLNKLIRTEEKLDDIEERLEEMLEDLRFTFNPTERPRLSQAVDILNRSKGPAPLGTRPYESDYTTGVVDFTTYKRALTLSMDAMLHTYGVDPVNYIFAQQDEYGQPLIPKPQGKPANCQEMEEMSYINEGDDAELAPIDVVIEEMQQSALLDIMTLLWKLLLYFVYGFIIYFCKKLKLTKIPAGIGKKVKKFIKKLKRKRAEILCEISGDCSDLEDTEDTGLDYEGFDDMDHTGDEFWSGVECLTAAKTVLDFVNRSAAGAIENQANINIPAGVDTLGGSDGGDGGADTPGGDESPPVEGRVSALPLYTTVQRIRDLLEAEKFNAIMEVPSSEEDLQPLVDTLEEGTHTRKRYRNRYFNRNAQAWRNLR